MKQTKNILKQLETQYLNIEYYHTIVEKIEENVLSNPDIAIESCKSLFEGLGKFIILNIDKSLNFNVVDNFKYKRAISKAVELLETRDPEFESDFSKKLLDVLDLIGNIRNDRGDISHGRLALKPETSDNHFSNFVMVLTDSFASYLLISFLECLFQKNWHTRTTLSLINGSTTKIQWVI
ncbi:MAG: abortive infection family protein [Bacteroidetes bacterium]|nr:abortive infection family protein [Bacteroidota bacterium]